MTKRMDPIDVRCGQGACRCGGNKLLLKVEVNERGIVLQIPCRSGKGGILAIPVRFPVPLGRAA